MPRVAKSYAMPKSNQETLPARGASEHVAATARILTQWVLYDTLRAKRRPSFLPRDLPYRDNKDLHPLLSAIERFYADVGVWIFPCLLALVKRWRKRMPLSSASVDIVALTAAVLANKLLDDEYTNNCSVAMYFKLSLDTINVFEKYFLELCNYRIHIREERAAKYMRKLTQNSLTNL